MFFSCTILIFLIVTFCVAINKSGFESINFDKFPEWRGYFTPHASTNFLILLEVRGKITPPLWELPEIL